MKTIERYVFSSFLTSFLLAFLVLSFVLTIGLMVQIAGLILDGVDAGLVWRFAYVSFPETMQWTIPLGLLVSSVLVFSRLSADSEIAAMRACGINIMSVIKWPALFAFACTAVALFVNNEIVPRGHEVRRSLKSRVTVGTGLDILEQGRWIDDFPKMKLYFGKRDGNWLYDMLAMDYSNENVDRMIRASKALVTSEGRDVHLDLYDMTVDPLDETHPGMMRVARYEYVVQDALKESKYNKKEKDFRFFELLDQIRSSGRERKRIGERLSSEGVVDEATVKEAKKGLAKRATKLKVEFSKRIVFALASLCFVLVGIPLGIRSQRKESTVGMAISLAVALGYYLLVLLMLSLYKMPSIHPEALIFLPVATSLAMAIYFTRKHL